MYFIDPNLENYCTTTACQGHFTKSKEKRLNTELVPIQDK